MSENPLREELRAPFEDDDLHRVWSRVAHQRSTPAAPKLPWAIAAAAVIVAIVAVAMPREPQVLTLSSGDALGDLSVGTHHLSDGSSISVAPEARFETLASSARELAFLLEQGRIEVSIVPGGERRFTFECGLATVEVVGTRFTLDRTKDRLTIEVKEGTVLVRSALLKDAVQRISAGEHMQLEPKIPVPVPVPVPKIQVPKIQVPKIQVPKIQVPKIQVPKIQVPKIQVPDPTAESLLEQADEARRSKKNDEAVVLFRRVIEEHPTDPQAALAAFALGKLQLEEDPKAAAIAFERALAIGLPNALVEDAHVRLIEAHLASSDRDAARRMAKLYLSRFPQGRHRARLTELVE